MPTKESVNPYVFVIRSFLAADECEEYIEFSEARGFGDAPITTADGSQVVAKGVRNNERVMVDNVARASDLWERAQPFCPEFVNGVMVVDGTLGTFFCEKYGNLEKTPVKIPIKNSRAEISNWR